MFVAVTASVVSPRPHLYTFKRQSCLAAIVIMTLTSDLLSIREQRTKSGDIDTGLQRLDERFQPAVNTDFC